MLPICFSAISLAKYSGEDKFYFIPSAARKLELSLRQNSTSGLGQGLVVFQTFKIIRFNYEYWTFAPGSDRL
jgi:hypothetical protein